MKEAKHPKFTPTLPLNDGIRSKAQFMILKFNVMIVC